MSSAVIFDLDFTLIDSSEAVILCAKAGFAAAGLEPPPDEVVVQNIGMSFQEFAARYAGKCAAQVIAAFREESHRLAWLDSTCMMPGAQDLLDELRQRGLRLGMATQKSKPALDAILQHHCLTRFFSAVVSGDCVARRKPSPDALLECLRLLDTDPQHTIYVGDHPYDIMAARAAGIRVVSVAAGPTPWSELEVLEPDWLISSIAELPLLLPLP